MRNFRQRQILFGRCGSKRNRGLNVLGLQAREIGKNFFGRITGSQAGKHRTQSDARVLEHGLAPADFRITNDPILVVLRFSIHLGHGASFRPIISPSKRIQFEELIQESNSL